MPSEPRSEDHDIEKGTPRSDTVEQQHSTSKLDNNIIDWDGPLDPEMPLNWGARKKWTNVLVVAVLTLLT